MSRGFCPRRGFRRFVHRRNHEPFNNSLGRQSGFPVFHDGNGSWATRSRFTPTRSPLAAQRRKVYNHVRHHQRAADKSNTGRMAFTGLPPGKLRQVEHISQSGDSVALTITIDTTPPAAALIANSIAAGSSPDTFTIVYTDANGVNIASLGKEEYPRHRPRQLQPSLQPLFRPVPTPIPGQAMRRIRSRPPRVAGARQGLPI